MKLIIMLFLASLLIGCGTTSQQWAKAFQNYEENYATPSRDYIADPIEREPMQNQEITWGTSHTDTSQHAGDSFQYIENTPNGLIFMNCQPLKGGNVYCE